MNFLLAWVFYTYILLLSVAAANQEAYHADQDSDDHYFYTGFQEAFPGHPCQVDA